MVWERARSEEQKRERVSEVLRVARELLEEKPFYGITMAEIARALSFTRANLYKYFASREEVFLSLLTREIEAFGERLETRWRSQEQGAATVEGFLSLWVPALAKESLLLTLTSMAGTILEKNCSDRVLLESKVAMAAAVERSFLPMMRAFFPGRSDEALAQAMNMLVVLANGLFPFCGLSQPQKDLLRNNGLGEMVHEFEAEYAAMLSPFLATL